VLKSIDATYLCVSVRPLGSTQVVLYIYIIIMGFLCADRGSLYLKDRGLPCVEKILDKYLI